MHALILVLLESPSNIQLLANMADPEEGNAIKTKAMAIASKTTIWGPSLVAILELSAFSDDDVLPGVVAVAGVAEAFDVKIAASAELGDKPRSSVMARQNTQLHMLPTN